MRLEWSEPAEFDLDDIYDFIARDSPVYADQFIDRIINAVATLRDNAKLGRKVPEANQEHVRELIFQSYRIIYFVRLDCIQVLAVIHGSRDLAGQSTKPWNAG